MSWYQAYEERFVVCSHDLPKIRKKLKYILSDINVAVKTNVKSELLRI